MGASGGGGGGGLSKGRQNISLNLKLVIRENETWGRGGHKEAILEKQNSC